MRTQLSNYFIAAIVVTLAATAALAAPKKSDVKKDLDSLGGNEALVERAKLLDPNSKTRVVQKRSVDRENRIELSGGAGLIAGGDSYVNTQSMSLSLQYHFTPRISLGVGYSKHYNDLTNEGRTVFDDAKRRQANGENFEVPDLDYPIQTTMAFLNVYPIYGKLNFFNLGISQFDLYVQLGYGKIELSSGNTDVYSAGGGAGIWWNNWLTTRIESKWQTYQDKLYSGSRKLDTVFIGASIGVML